MLLAGLTSLSSSLAAGQIGVAVESSASTSDSDFTARVYDGEFGVPYGGGSYFDESFGGHFSWNLTDPESGETWKTSYTKDKQQLEDYVVIDLDIFNLDYQRNWNVNPEHLVT